MSHLPQKPNVMHSQHSFRCSRLKCNLLIRWNVFLSFCFNDCSMIWAQKHRHTQTHSFYPIKLISSTIAAYEEFDVFTHRCQTIFFILLNCATDKFHLITSYSPVNSVTENMRAIHICHSAFIDNFSTSSYKH